MQVVQRQHLGVGVRVVAACAAVRAGVDRGVFVVQERHHSSHSLEVLVHTSRSWAGRVEACHVVVDSLHGALQGEVQGGHVASLGHDASGLAGEALIDGSLHTHYFKDAYKMWLHAIIIDSDSVPCKDKRKKG